MVKGRDTLRALLGVKTPPTGQMEWRYVSEKGDDLSNGGMYTSTGTVEEVQNR